jgi:hypothetical protein
MLRAFILFFLSFGTPHTANTSKTNCNMSSWTTSVVVAAVATTTSRL